MSTPTNITVLTYNVWNVWRIGRQAYNRDDMIADVLLENAPDIACLQEFDGPFRHEENSLIKMISHEYTEAKPDSVPEDDNWNPVFYRNGLFTLIECGHHVYTYGTEYTYRLTSRSHFRTATWAVLRHSVTGEVITVVNTHYDTDESNHLSESNELSDIAGELYEKYGGHILVTGDYNCRVRGIAVQNMFSRGFKDTEALAEDNQATSGCHPYPVLNEETHLYDTYDDNFYAHTYDEAIDHIMLYGSARVKSYKTVINERTLLTSDHSPVTVQMTLM